MPSDHYATSLTKHKLESRLDAAVSAPGDPEPTGGASNMHPGCNDSAISDNWDQIDVMKAKRLITSTHFLISCVTRPLFPQSGGISKVTWGN